MNCSAAMVSSVAVVMAVFMFVFMIMFRFMIVAVYFSDFPQYIHPFQKINILFYQYAQRLRQCCSRFRRFSFPP
ncbi:MAG: hypothetical protein VR69_10120 [Peptococcaceae bacterium BRH_c4b]|nr:MAG: hypothetical protein VR69_10120 [Peptococcaceae bacterium BRH_c4b]